MLALEVQDRPDVLPFDVEVPANKQELTVRPPSWYAERGYDYVVLNSNFFEQDRDPAPVGPGGQAANVAAWAASLGAAARFVRWSIRSCWTEKRRCQCRRHRHRSPRQHLTCRQVLS